MISEIIRIGIAVSVLPALLWIGAIIKPYGGSK